MFRSPDPPRCSSWGEYNTLALACQGLDPTFFRLSGSAAALDINPATLDASVDTSKAARSHGIRAAADAQRGGRGGGAGPAAPRSWLPPPAERCRVCSVR